MKVLDLSDVGCVHGIRVFECEECYPPIAESEYGDQIDTTDDSEWIDEDA